MTRSWGSTTPTQPVLDAGGGGVLLFEAFAFYRVRVRVRVRGWGGVGWGVGMVLEGGRMSA